MRLRYVETVHFGKSELTNFLDLVRRRPEFMQAKSKARLGSDDVVLFVSRIGNQLMFLHGFDAFQETQVLRSLRLRINSGRWNPLMLVNYAKAVGLDIQGLKAYEDHVKKLLEQ